MEHSPKQVSKIIGKKLKLVKTFGATEDFEAIQMAEECLEKEGYSVGSMQNPAPMGVAKGDIRISKWYNLGEDVKRLDGVLLAPKFSFREGPIELWMAE